MEPELFRSVCDQLVEHKMADTISFHLMGEPFIHKSCIEFIAYAKQVGLKVVLTTNASLLTEKNTDSVFDNLYGSLILSMQTPTAASYAERGVKNMTFDRYRDQIRAVVKRYLERNRGVQDPNNYVEVHFLNTKYGRPGVDVVNTDELAREVLQEWLDFTQEVGREIGVDFGVHELPPMQTMLIPQYHGYHFEVAPGVVIRFKVSGTFANSRIDPGATVVPTTTGFCGNPFNMFGVLWNGCCTLCCVDYDGEIFIGNANDTPIREIWFGDKAEEIRNGFRRNEVVHPFCQYCLGAVVPAGQAAASVAPAGQAVPLELINAGPAKLELGHIVSETVHNFKAGGLPLVAKHSVGYVQKLAKARRAGLFDR